MADKVRSEEQYQTLIAEKDKELAEIKNLFSAQLALIDRITKALEVAKKALNKIAMASSSELAYTSDFTEIGRMTSTGALAEIENLETGEL